MWISGIVVEAWSSTSSTQLTIRIRWRLWCHTSFSICTWQLHLLHINTESTRDLRIHLHTSQRHTLSHESLTLETRKATWPNGVKNDAYLRPCVTLTFDLLTPKVDHFMFLPRERGPLVPICIKICRLVFKMSYSQVWQQTDGQTDGQSQNIMPLDG